MGWNSGHENKFYEIDAQNYRLNEINKPYEDSDNFSISDLSVQLRYRWQIAHYLIFTLLPQNQDLTRRNIPHSVI